jgi:hypothetical protein
VLSDLSPEEEADVRRVDVALAARRLSNKSPHLLSPKSLREYQRRVKQAIEEFTKYQESPSSYAGLGQTKPGRRQEGAEQRKRKSSKGTAPPVEAQDSSVRATTPPASVITGLSFSFPLRPDFLAQIVVPRDLRADEAKRLSVFISALAVDFTGD